MNAKNQLGQVMQMLKSGNPNQIYEQLYRTNPEFRKFIEDNKGKSPEQISQEYGVDYKQIFDLFR